MDSEKVIRSVCLFRNNPGKEGLEKLKQIRGKLTDRGFVVQTLRVCTPPTDPLELEERLNNPELLLSIGTLNLSAAQKYLKSFYSAKNVSFNTDLTSGNIKEEHVNLLFDIITNDPGKTFNFAYVFNNASSSPYFPSATYDQDGFSIGLQPTDLAQNCRSLDEWLQQMKKTWQDIYEIYKGDPEFLGIDSSIAPLFRDNQSLVNFIRKVSGSFSASVTSNLYMQITCFIKEENPKPVGLCGLMLPCLEDFELAEEYEKGEFSIERNIFLSLHSGLGIDTYPIGIDENREKVLSILKLIQDLSNKYKKPLSVRFVSDGKAKIGMQTDFKNQYLKDIKVLNL